MYASQRAFLGGILDYAGMFPPARLSLNESIRNYARYLQEPDPWMLGRFVCPVSHLGELTPYITELFSGAAPLRLSVLGRGGDMETTFLENLRIDLAAVGRFRERHGTQATVECVDVRLPASLAGSEGSGLATNVLESAAECFEAEGLAKLPCFYELPSAADYRQAAGVVAGVLAALDRSLTAGALRDVGLSSLSPEEPVLDPLDQGDRRAGGGTAGIKLRCGGLQPSAMPTADQVASVIEESVRARRPLKFTAGLHSPIRRVDPALGIHVHGFLNVFAAAMLTAALGLEHPDVVAIVEEEDFREFRFSEDFFAWNEAEVTIGEIEYARRHQAISFGSCSFEEPRDELRSLGLI